jgi:periplasmic protein TonB
MGISQTRVEHTAHMNTSPLLNLSPPGTLKRGAVLRVNAFLLISLTVHGLGLLGLIALGESVPPSAFRLLPNELQLVELDAPQAAIAPATAFTTRSTRVTRPLQRTVPSMPTREANAAVSAPAVRTPATETAVTHDIATADTTAPEAATSEINTTPALSLADTKVLILSYLRLTLDVQKTYPPLAHHYGWQGDVLLAFHVDPTGAIQNVHVTHSSGYAVLDQSAVNALQRVGNIPNAAHWLSGGVTDLELPISYQLHEG